MLVRGVVILAAICLRRFFRYSSLCWSWVLVVPLSKVGTACTRKVIPDCRLLVVLQELPMCTEIRSRRASILALILDAVAQGAVVTTMLPFLLWCTPIGSASITQGYWLYSREIKNKIYVNIFRLSLLANYLIPYDPIDGILYRPLLLPML